MAVIRLGWVYFILAPEVNLVKIGRTNDHPDFRFEVLATMSPVKLTMLGAIHGRSDHERALHDVFRMHRSHGEWFHYRDELSVYIQRDVPPWPKRGHAPPEVLWKSYPAQAQAWGEKLSRRAVQLRAELDTLAAFP